MEYIVILLFTLYCSFNYDQFSEKTTRFVWAFSFLYLTGLSAFQYRIGADMPAYIGEFSYYNNDFSIEYLSGFHRRQPLWILLNLICRNMWDDFASLKILQAVIVNLSVFAFVSKHCNNKMLGVFVYLLTFYLHLNFNAIRASMALSVFLFSYDYLISKQWIKYYLCVLIAFLFHESSIVLVLLPLIHFIKIPQNGKFMTVIIILACISPFLGSIIRYQFASWLSLLQSYNIISYGETYLDNDYYTGFALSITGLVEFFITVYVYIALLKSNTIKESGFNDILFLFFIIIFILNVAFPIFYRFNDFLCISFVCCVANGLNSLKKIRYGHGILNRTTIILFLLLINIYPLFVRSSQYNERPIAQFYPYYSIFNKQISPARERIWGYKEDTTYIY